MSGTPADWAEVCWVSCGEEEGAAVSEQERSVEVKYRQIKAP